MTWIRRLGYFNNLSKGASSNSNNRSHIIVEVFIAESGKTEQQAEEMKVKAIALSQGYGNFFSAILPTLALVAVFTIHYLTGCSEWALLILFAVGGGTQLPTGRALPPPSSQYWSQFTQFVYNFLQKSHISQFRVSILFLCMVLSILTVTHVNTYLMVSQFHQIDLWNADFSTIALSFFMLAAFDLSHYPKGMVVPFISKHLSSNQSIYFSLVSQCFLAGVAIYCHRPGYVLETVIGFVLVFNAIFSCGNTILQSKLLSEIPQHLRASLFSLVHVVLVSYRTYSTHLTARGSGIDYPGQIFVQLLCLSGAGILLSILFDLAALLPGCRSS